MDSENPYQSPEAPLSDPRDGDSPQSHPGAAEGKRWYRVAFTWGLTVQGVLLLLTSLLLDGGNLFRLTCTAVAGYWIAMLIIVGRRPASPTRMDVDFAKYGTFLCCAVVGLLRYLIGLIL